MIGSWAGAMGHTQWMPEVWLHMGVDFDHDGRITPFGKPDDSLAGTARYLVERGNTAAAKPGAARCRATAARRPRLAHLCAMARLGVTRADGAAVRAAGRQGEALGAGRGRAGLPDRPELLARSIPTIRVLSYTLAVCHLGDLIRGEPPFQQQFPGGERAPTLAEVKEIQRRLTAHGFKTDGIDGRTGSDTSGRGAAFPKEGRHGAGRRLCRLEGAGAVASKLVIRLGCRPLTAPGAPCRPESVPMSTTRSSARPQPARQTTDIAGLDRPIPAGVNAAGFGSDVVAEALRALDIPYIALNPGASYRGLHDSLVNYLGNERAADAALPARGKRGRDRARLCQGHRQGDGGGGAFQCRADARHHGDLQRLVRPHADGDARRHRAGRRGQAAALDRLDSHHRATRARSCATTPNGTTSRPRPPPRAKRCCAPAGSPTPRRAGRLYINLDAEMQESKLAEPLPPLDASATCRRWSAPPRPSSITQAAELLARRQASGDPRRAACRASETAWNAARRAGRGDRRPSCTDLKVGAAFPTDHPLHVDAPGDDFTKDELTPALRAADVDPQPRLGRSRRHPQAARRCRRPPRSIQVSLDHQLHNGWSMDYQGLPPVDLFISADPDIAVAALLAGDRTGRPRSGRRRIAAAAP